MRSGCVPAENFLEFREIIKQESLRVLIGISGVALGSFKTRHRLNLRTILPGFSVEEGAKEGPEFGGRDLGEYQAKERTKNNAWRVSCSFFLCKIKPSEFVVLQTTVRSSASIE
eukprot:191230_1